MGTSRSFRSPATPRWHDSPLAHRERRSTRTDPAELFNAGVLDGWNAEFGRPGISRLRGGASRGARRARRRVSERRAALGRDRATRRFRNPPTCTAQRRCSNSAIAERALTRTLLGTAREDAASRLRGPTRLLDAWDRHRGTPAELVSRFLGDVLHQFTCHVSPATPDRSSAAVPHERESRATARGSGRDESQVPRRLDRRRVAARDLPRRWPSLINEAFRRAAAPGAGRMGDVHVIVDDCTTVPAVMCGGTSRDTAAGSANWHFNPERVVIGLKTRLPTVRWTGSRSTARCSRRTEPPHATLVSTGTVRLSCMCQSASRSY